MIYLFIYLMGVVKALAFTCGLLGTGLAIFGFGFYLEGRIDLKQAKRLWAWAIPLIVVSVITPSKQSMELIAAVYVGDQVLQMEQVQEVGSKSFEVLDQ